MLEHTKTHRIEIKINEGRKSHIFNVPSKKAKELISSLGKYKKKSVKFETSLLWEDVLKDDIENAGGSSAYFVRAARVGADMTQKELAEKLNMPQSNISHIEKGKRPVGKILAKKLAKIFNVDYRTFL